MAFETSTEEGVYPVAASRASGERRSTVAFETSTDAGAYPLAASRASGERRSCDLLGSCDGVDGPGHRRGGGRDGRGTRARRWRTAWRAGG